VIYRLSPFPQKIWWWWCAHIDRQHRAHNSYTFFLFFIFFSFQQAGVCLLECVALHANILSHSLFLFRAGFTHNSQVKEMRQCVLSRFSSTMHDHIKTATASYKNLHFTSPTFFCLFSWNIWVLCATTIFLSERKKCWCVAWCYYYCLANTFVESQQGCLTKPIMLYLSFFVSCFILYVVAEHGTLLHTRLYFSLKLCWVIFSLEKTRFTSSYLAFSFLKRERERDELLKKELIMGILNMNLHDLMINNTAFFLNPAFFCVIYWCFVDDVMVFMILHDVWQDL